MADNLLKIYRRCLVFGIVAAGCCMLGGCGDDMDVVLPVIKPSDLEQPIGGGAAGKDAEAGEGHVSPDGGAGAAGEGSLADQTGAQTNGGQEASVPSGNAAGGEDTSAAGSGNGSGDSGVGNSEGEETQGRVTVTISAAGDVTLGNHQAQDYWYSFRQAYDQAEGREYFFENVKDIFTQDDMTIVNLEGTLTFSEDMTEGLTYNIKGDPDYALLLPEGGIEAVSMGNNHRLDYGEEGSRDTVEAVEQAGLVYAYDDLTGIYETKGVRIGFVSVNEAYWHSGVEKTLEQGIGRLKEEGVDLILACCHWGTERDNYPGDYQKTLGRKCIDWGADLVIGHHPHVLQGVEEYQGKYIVYSLGNFCFGANRNPEDKDTMIFQQTFTFENGEKTEETQARVIPCSVSSTASRNDFKPTPAQGEEARRIISRLNEYSLEMGVSIDSDGVIISDKN